MSYYSLRITLGELFNVADEDITTEHKQRVKNLINAIVTNKVCEKKNYVLAKEKKNKYGDDTKYHYHFNFQSDDTKDTLRKWILRRAEKSDMVLRGNKIYALAQHTEPEDYCRWFRYCLKEKYDKRFTKYNPKEGQSPLEDLIKLAKDERERTQKINREQREKLNEKKTYYDKLCEKLDEEKVSSDKDVYISICKKYVEDKKPVNTTTIGGYTNTYRLERGHISYELFYQKNRRS